jgi:hypothetical protein
MTINKVKTDTLVETKNKNMGTIVTMHRNTYESEMEHRIRAELLKNMTKAVQQHYGLTFEEFNQIVSIQNIQELGHQRVFIIPISDPKSFLSPALGFSIKSQLGAASTLVNASGATNLCYLIKGKTLTPAQIDTINTTEKFTEKFSLLKRYGAKLKFEEVDHEIFQSNLQTIDYHFDIIVAKMLLLYYGRDGRNTVKELIEDIASENPLKYNLTINSSMYEMMMKKFLTDYALGMRASKVWKRKYEATGGYLIVRQDGELVCYHFYFMKEFEDYLFNNTRLETPGTDKHGFGNIYTQNGQQKMKLNLQIRFTK